MASNPPWDTRERAFEFACDIVRLCLKLGGKQGCRALSEQLLRAGTGIGANTEESKSAYSRREFALKNSYALKEARESQYWLRLLLRCDLADDPEEVRRLLAESGELVGILTATVRSARRANV
jgi:four helix bundle protein